MAKEIIDAESKQNVKENMMNLFIDEMNKECNILGMNDTHYANVHGLPNPYNISTAFDQAKLCRMAMEDEQFRQVVNS